MEAQPPVMAPREAPPFWKQAAIGGGISGALAGLPMVGLVNCACCALVWGGGLAAAYLYAQECGSLGVAFSAGRGAQVGVAAGVFYLLASIIVGGLMQILGLAPDPAQILEMLGQMEALPPEVREALEQTEASPGAAMMLVGLMVQIPVVLVFSTLGGLLGGVFFKKEGAPMVPGAGE